MLSQHADATYAIELLRNGTDGLAYLLKERIEEPRQLLAAIDTVATGGSVIDADVVGVLVSRPRGGRSHLSAGSPPASATCCTTWPRVGATLASPWS